jgi:hypothetical protein
VPMTARQRIAWPPNRRQRGREPACLQHRASANIASFTPILAWRARIIVGGSHLGWGLAACGIETVSQRSVQSNSVYRESFSHLASIAQEVSEGELLRFDKNVMPRRTSEQDFRNWGRHRFGRALALQEFETFDTRSGQDECTHSDRARGCAARQHAADMPPVSAASTPRCAAVRSGWPGSIFAH